MRGTATSSVAVRPAMAECVTSSHPLISQIFQGINHLVEFERIPQGAAKLGCTPRGSCNRTLLRRVLRRFSNSKCFLEGFLEGACKGFW